MTTDSNHNREIKEHSHERNTKIPTGNIQQHRVEFQQQAGYSGQNNQGLTSPNERITKTGKQLGAILEHFDRILQQIIEFIPKIVRKIEPLRSNDERTHEKEKSKVRGMGR